MELLIDTLIYAVATIIGAFAFLFLVAFSVAFYRVYIKKERPALRRSNVKTTTLTPEEIQMIKDQFISNETETIKAISKLSDEDKLHIIEQIKADDRNWIQLHVDKIGDMLYFYDGDEKTGKFLFQCRTYDEMVDNLEKIRGKRGVRVNADLVQKLQMEDFFLKAVKKEANDESV